MKKYRERRRGLNKSQRRKLKFDRLKNKRLIKKYPWLMPTNWLGFPVKNYDYSWIEWGWSAGWDKAFGWQYLKELGEAVKESGRKDFRILQQKEKYGCYDSETEVLTKKGWKFFKDLSYEDEIATLNRNNNHLEYQNPSEIIAEHYKGKMYRLENRGISLCVTPNHNLYVAKGSDFRGTKGNFTKHYYDFELCNPQKYYGVDKRFLKTCKWNGVNKYKKYKIKGLEYDSPISIKNNNMKMRHYVCEDLEFELIPWLRFLGFYVAEGYVSNKKNQDRYNDIRIAFNPYDEKELVTKLINDIGFSPAINIERGSARFCNSTLAVWLNENCGHGAINKKVPDFIKELPSEYIKEFLEYLFIGDGHKTPTSNILSTISKQLSDDVQELLLKAGYCFRETIRDRRNRFGGYGRDGHEIRTRHLCYEINWLQLPDIEIDMSKAKKTKSFQEEWIDYSGCVYCVTVPNHVIYVRRNGKGIWCGNSARNYTSGNTQKVLDIIDKYERVSQHICYYCGIEAPITDNGWVLPQCFDCFRRLYKRNEKWYLEHHPDQVEKTDEEIQQMYERCICVKPDEDGKYHIPKLYTSKCCSAGGDWQEVVHDYSETVEKIQNRIEKFHKKVYITSDKN